MRNKKGRKQRVFPYYIVINVNEETQKIEILDLNTIQTFSEEDAMMLYEENVDLHDRKWIPLPGSSKAEKERIISWMKAMMGDTFMHKNKCMVYNHRAHFTNPIHEEYKRAVFCDWEKHMNEIAEKIEKEEIFKAFVDDTELEE